MNTKTFIRACVCACVSVSVFLSLYMYLCGYPPCHVHLGSRVVGVRVYVYVCARFSRGAYNCFRLQVPNQEIDTTASKFFTNWDFENKTFTLQVCVCVCAGCAHVCICTRVFWCVRVYIYMHIYVYTHARVYIHMCVRSYRHSSQQTVAKQN
jgi:hypothetical protein